MIRRYTKSGDRYTSRYTNDPQKGCIQLNAVEHACSNTSQNEAVFIQWTQVKMKKRLVGMETKSPQGSTVDLVFFAFNGESVNHV